ncbi:MAG: Tad domain-containing protein [Nocardioides sp.]|nr:Tad domain-containing protein [Nocardioides sp.]
MTGRRCDESGQISVLIIGFFIVLILTVGVVVDASAAFLQRQGLDTLADGAALRGADEVGGEATYETGIDRERIQLDTARARDAVRGYLTSIGAYAAHPGLHVSVEIRDRSVVVFLKAPLDLPIHVGGVTDADVGSRGAAAVVVEE